MLTYLIAAAEAPENKFGFVEAMREGGPVAWSILAVMIIMSVGSFYILFSKLFEQNKVMGQYKKSKTAFWRAGGLKDGATKFEKNSAWRQRADDAVKARDDHAKMHGAGSEASYVEDSLAHSQETINASLSGGLQDLQMRQERLMAITGEAGAAELDLHQELLERVSSYCVNNRLVLEEFPKPVISQSNDFQVETTIFTVEGRFIPLLRLVHDLEQEWGLGKISGVEFASRKNNRANRKELTVSISFQQVKRIKSKNT